MKKHQLIQQETNINDDQLLYDVIDIDIAYNFTKTIVKNLSFQVKKGEFVSILGPNGAGKSTLIKALCRIQNTSKGTILFENKLVHRQNALAFYARFFSLKIKKHLATTSNLTKVKKQIEDIKQKIAKIQEVDIYEPSSVWAKLQIGLTFNQTKKNEWKEYYRQNEINKLNKKITKKEELFEIDSLIAKETKYFKQNKKIKAFSSNELAKRLAYVPQILDFPRNIKVYDFVKLGRFPHRKIGFNTKKEDEIIMKTLENVEMTAFSNAYLEDLSGGQQQRCMIALALAQDTQTIVLDEPTNHLDVKAQLEIVDLLHHLNHDLHKTIILVIHDLNYSIRYSDKSLVLKNGQLVAFGDTQEVITSKILKDVFEVNTKIGYDYRNRKFIEYAWLDQNDSNFITQSQTQKLADLMQSAPVLSELAAKKIDQISFLLNEGILSRKEFLHLKDDIINKYRFDAMQKEKENLLS